MVERLHRQLVNQLHEAELDFIRDQVVFPDGTRVSVEEFPSDKWKFIKNLPYWQAPEPNHIVRHEKSLEDILNESIRRQRNGG